jgi:Caspase domain
LEAWPKKTRKSSTKEPAVLKKSLPLLFSVKRLPIAVVMGLLFICSDLAYAQGKLPDCFVLSVGVDDYAHISKLKGDVNDARNTAAAFTAQQGKLFGKVSAQTMLDGEATRGKIVSRMLEISKAGKAGDYVVLFMSGHGGVFKDTQTWYFVPCDFDPKNASATSITDKQLLTTADVYVRQGKKVLIIIDACFSGQLRKAAQPYLLKYSDPKAGGMIVMVSSGADQMSNALGDYSAFAKAFADSMAGDADLNRDGKVTLEEIMKFSGKRTHDLLKKAGNQAKQDSIIAWSANIPNDLTLALPAKAGAALARAQMADNPPAGFAAWTVFTGTENLPGFGPLAFTCTADGRVVMADAKGMSMGTWQETGGDVTLRFSDGRVVYSGKLTGSRMSGNANNGTTTWAWSVQLQTVGRTDAVAIKN